MMKTQGEQTLVNVGCGARHHPGWVNLDLAGGPGVTAHDLRTGLPFADAAVDAVYHSHVLEHLDPDGGERLVGECRRVLKPGGVLRVVVPDLEGIARAYLAALDRAAAGEPGGVDDHAWMVTELVDQMVRTEPGGRMGRRLAARPGPNDAFVTARIGDPTHPSAPLVRPSVWARLSAAAGRPRATAAAAVSRLAATAVTWTAGKAAAEAYREVMFRRTGEVHRWMYDRVSLGRLLTTSGFRDVARCRADESRIPGFVAYALDTDESGRVRKPDSLFMEATR